MIVEIFLYDLKFKKKIQLMKILAILIILLMFFEIFYNILIKFNVIHFFLNINNNYLKYNSNIYKFKHREILYIFMYIKYFFF